MFERDYIMRMVQQLATFMERLLIKRKSGDSQAVEEALRTTSREILGMELHTLRSFADASLISILRIGGEFNLTKALVMAELLREDGANQHEQGRSGAAYHSNLSALSLLLEVALSKKENPTEINPAERIETLYQKLKEYDLPVHIELKKLDYFRQEGRYADAEDTIFALLDRRVWEAAEIGISFFESIKGLDDTELTAGGLSREEVQEALDSLEERLARSAEELVPASIEDGTPDKARREG